MELKGKSVSVSEGRAVWQKGQPCDECGETGRIKASASRTQRDPFGSGWHQELRLFCHDEEKSCYNHRRGRYFEDEN